MRRGDRLLVLAGAIAGVVLALVVTLLQASTYRADASIALVRQGQPPGDDPALAQAAEAAAALFRSRAVAEPAIANLRLEDSADELLERVSFETEAESSLVRVSVDAPSRDEARRTAQELTELATVLFNDRFGPETTAAVWETPRVEDDPVSRRPARNLSIGALLGALLGSALLLARDRRRTPTRVVVGTAGSSVLEARIAAVTARELELARRAGAVARRERALSDVPAPATPAPTPIEASSPPVETPQAFVLPRLGEWTVESVERLLAEHGAAFPELVEELGFYLESFRGVAGPDGSVPGGVEVVIEDVFGPLLVRAREQGAATG